MKNRTLLITVFHSFISKNLLNTDVFRILREQPDTTIVLLVPKNKEEFFRSTYQTPRIKIHGIDSVGVLGDPQIKRYSAFSHLLVRSHYLWYKKVERLQKNKTLKGYLKFWFELAFTRVFGNRKWARAQYREKFLKNIHVPTIAQAFDELKPDMVFATDVFDETDVLVMREARVRKIHLLGMVRSWDNCFSKGVLRVVPDTLIVNNFELKKEAHELHDVPDTQIHVCGLPQYDHFITGVRTPRDEFFKEIGADPNKKLILFSPAGSILSDTDTDLCDIFKKALENNVFVKPTQFLVRNHPHHPANLDQFEGDKEIIVEYPGKRFSQNLKETELTNLDSRHLADSLYHADIVIYVATTLGLDSLNFDKPQIIIDFDGYKTKRYTQSVKRYHHEDHMKKMIRCKGVRVAENEQELFSAINTYLEHPEADHDGRVRMIEQQLVYTDGLSGKRVASVVVDELGKV